MDKIGDYIHLHAENYRQYGIWMQTSRKKHKITRKKIRGSEKKNDVHRICKEVTRKLQTRIKTLKTFPNSKELEDKLSFFTSKGTGNIVIDEKVQQAIEQMLIDDFGKSLGEVNLDTIDVSSAYLHKAKSKTEKLYRDALKSKQIYLSTIYRRLKTIETLIATLDKKSPKYKELSEKLRQAYHIVQNMTGDYIRTIKREVKTGELAHDSIRSKERYTTQLNGKEVNLIDFVNSLLNDPAISTAAIAKQKGNLFEYVIAAVAAQSNIIEEDSVETIIEKIKKFHKGSNTSNITIDFEDNFSHKLNYDKISASMKGYTKDGYIYQSVLASQGKVDVEFKWGDSIQKVSAKNYNLFGSHDISIVDGQPLLYLLQDEDHRFVNHYLNAAAKHINLEADRGEKEPTENDYFNIHSEYQESIELMKKIILFKSLTGKTFGRDGLSATVLIVNNNKVGNKEGKVRIYDMRDLLKAANSDIELYSKIVGNDEPFSSLSFANKKADAGYQDRITDLLMDVHKIKITAHLKKSVFKAADEIKRNRT